jgi:autotransporter translocation and assembly factor TamB
MRLEGTADAEVEKLLRQYGLKSLSGSGEIDLRADYDQAKPRQWYASGSLVLKGVKAVSHPAGVRLDDLQGRVTVKRKKTTEITVGDLTARVNQSPIQIQGKLSGGGTDRFVVDGKARTEGLDLKKLSGLFSPLKEFELAGILDMNIDVHYPHADPGKSTFRGTVKSRGIGFRLAAQDLTITEGDGDIELAGNTVMLKGMTLKANDQKMSLSGQVTNFREPTARLKAKSPHLNVDRLLVPAKSTGTASKPSSKPPAEKPGTPKLERWQRPKSSQKRKLVNLNSPLSFASSTRNCRPRRPADSTGGKNFKILR